MKRWLVLLLLPVIWVPVLLLMLLALPALPWWSWLFGVIFWVLLARRRQSGDADSAVAVEGGVAWSPTRRSGGLW